jgi:SAM-dependent methyltransferase
MAEMRAQDAFREKGGEAWARLVERTDRQLVAYGRAACDALELAPGARVLDIGCGCGQTLLDLAARVGPSGRVTGVDVSEPMLAIARERCAGTAQIEIALGDAATHALPAASYDALFSRFGVMFFAEPIAAFTHLRRALAPGGKLAFVCWQGLEHNPWASVPLAAARRALPEAPLPPLLDPDLPGPFFFSDRARVERILSEAGFTDIALIPLELRTPLGGSLADAVDYLLQIGPTARLLADATPEQKSAVAAALSTALAPHLTPDGVAFQGAAWLVTAKNHP